MPVVHEGFEYIGKVQRLHPNGVMDRGFSLFMCGKCGAAVHDQEKHDLWHRGHGRRTSKWEEFVRAHQRCYRFGSH